MLVIDPQQVQISDHDRVYYQDKCRGNLEEFLDGRITKSFKSRQENVRQQLKKQKQKQLAK